VNVAFLHDLERDRIATPLRPTEPQKSSSRSASPGTPKNSPPRLKHRQLFPTALPKKISVKSNRWPASFAGTVRLRVEGQFPRMVMIRRASKYIFLISDEIILTVLILHQTMQDSRKDVPICSWVSPWSASTD
jgi:hypothetical protein